MLSIIIPAHNEELLLGRTLYRLTAALDELGHQSEVIVVDDSSTDRTAAIAEEHGVRVIHVNHRQIAATRNAGAREAQGDMLLFVDADTIVDAAVIRAAIASMQNGAVGGGCMFYFEGRLPLYGRIMQTLVTPFYRMAKLASGCFFFCLRDAFVAVGGFDEKLFAAEEGALSMALRRRGRFVILREGVTTSGRKLRTYTGREILGMAWRMVLTGPKAMRRREGLDIWYGERRQDPEEVANQARNAEDEWIVEIDGRPVALLTDAQCVEMFRTSYKIKPLAEDTETQAKLNDVEFWNAMEGMRFRHRSSGLLSDTAFPLVDALHRGRIVMRGMYCKEWMSAPGAPVDP
jgi:glycosyltransferase involved in cell wall biosynthesis